jgi:hypothetical protein
MQKANGLLCAVSCEFRAIDGDVGGVIGQLLLRMIAKLFERDVDGAGDVRFDVRLPREDVDYSERGIVEAALQLVARDLGIGG